MFRQFSLAMLALAAMAAGAAVQSSENDTPWRSSRPADPAPAATPVQDALVQPATASSPGVEPARLHRTGGMSLPNDAGQQWREYDISAYTARVTSTNRPEQAIIDWILRETGYETWHNDPLGILSASPRTLYVYHTPEMQKTVADVVDRFVSSEAASYTFSLRVVTLDSPNWRGEAHRLMRSVPVQTPGASAWLLAREDAAILTAQLRRRSDYREHSSPYLMVNNGQSTLVSMMRGRPYVRDVVLRPDAPAGFDPSPGRIDEGFNLDFSPLLSADRRTIDALVRCEVDQIEKMIPVMLDVPTRTSPRQRTKIEAPQFSHYRFCERFRWPIDQVLLVGMGMVALPMPVDGGAPMVPGVPLPIGTTPARADLLVFIECKGPSRATSAAGAGAAACSGSREAKNYRGRY